MKPFGIPYHPIFIMGMLYSSSIINISLCCFHTTLDALKIIYLITYKWLFNHRLVYVPKDMTAYVKANRESKHPLSRGLRSQMIRFISSFIFSNDLFDGCMLLKGTKHSSYLGHFYLNKDLLKITNLEPNNLFEIILSHSLRFKSTIGGRN